MERDGISKPKIMKLLKALIFSYVITGIMLVILALLLYKLNFDESKVTIGIIVVYILSCFLGGFMLGHRVGQQKFLWGMGLGLCYFFLMLAISTLVQPGAMNGLQHILSSFAMCMGGGMLGGMLS